VRIEDGKLHVIDGPYAEAKEVVGGYAVFELRNKEEEAMASAVELCNCRRTICRGGRERVRFARSRRAGPEACAYSGNDQYTHMKMSKFPRESSAPM
jgi:hypothetical protein